MSDQSWIDNLPNYIDVLENNTFVYDLGENLDDLSLNWEIRDGDDNSDEDDDGYLFVVDDKGVLSFKQPPDFEAIMRDRTNNLLKVSVKATHQNYPELYDIHNMNVYLVNVIEESKNTDWLDIYTFEITSQPEPEYEEGDSIFIDVKASNLPTKLGSTTVTPYIQTIFPDSGNSSDITNISSHKIRGITSDNQYLQLQDFSQLEVGKIVEDFSTEGDEIFSIGFKYYFEETWYELGQTSSFKVKDTSTANEKTDRPIYSISDATLIEGIPGAITLARTNTPAIGFGSTGGYLPNRTYNQIEYFDPLNGKRKGFDMDVGEYFYEFDLDPQYNETKEGTRKIDFTISIPGLFDEPSSYGSDEEIENSKNYLELHDLTSEITILDFPYELGIEYELSRIKDYDGNLHANLGNSDKYEYQGFVDTNDDGNKEVIFTNAENARWVTASLDPLTAQLLFDQNGLGGITRVVGIYNDPLIAEGEKYGGYLSDGITPAPANFGVSDEERYVEVNGETIDRLALNSQVRFQNDLRNKNLKLLRNKLTDNSYLSVNDIDSDGMGEVLWQLNDGTAFLRSIHHFDGNLQYANYMSQDQLVSFMGSYGNHGMLDNVGLPEGWADIIS